MDRTSPPTLLCIPHTTSSLSRRKEKASTGNRATVLSEVSEGFAIDPIFTESPALAKGFDSHQRFNQIVGGNLTLLLFYKAAG